ncbi:hypothetical protein BKA82DRAFT_997883 [Pisolithus tinctorius]|uniref:choline-phosphate cytidylyltransferase n=1 Tax=Pisolithus tinctorius Marx 270 TaxID=870435 RepID=A0A0C3JF85_PISTI|nr:hypothetical protein BKA82DRAFT_997883 [Pisolithus tinctorius]KIO07738.1 hypothetical protein M404DRAFT_997883 [Pisolithus tinctorius Marx 270]
MDTSSVLSDEDYDVISNPGQRSLESSVADFGHVIACGPIREIPPTDAARHTLSTVSLTAVDIQAYVGTALSTAAGRGVRCPADRTVRVYVDGMFDVLDAGRMLRLRQAKLSFASVHLMVGVFPDEAICHVLGSGTATAPRYPHVERCEAIRHVKWVDEIVPDAPWVLDDAFMIDKRIDYVVLEEGSSVNPEFDKERLKGYDELKRIGRVIPVRRTVGLVPKLTAPPASPLSRSANATPYKSPSELEPDTLQKGEGGSASALDAQC